MTTDPVDTIAPWTIKAVSTATRNAVNVAARKEGLTVGQWLEKRVAEWTADGGPVAVGTALVPVPPPAAPVDAGRYEAAAQLVRLAVELAGASPEARNDPLVRSARGAVRAMLATLR